jgi:hypothetical protein
MFGCFDPGGLSFRLKVALEKMGVRAQVLPAKRGTRSEQVFHAAFVAQLAALRRSRLIGLKEPAFLKSKGKLAASDDMIY